jgi:hypothetical protein
MLTFFRQRLNGITATLREPTGPDDTPEKLEEERLAAQDFIDNGMSHVVNNVGSPLIVVQFSRTSYRCGDGGEGRVHRRRFPRLEPS